MGVNPNQGQNPDPSGQYGGYTGYTPPPSTNPKDDPYNVQWYGPQAGTESQGGNQGAQQQTSSAGQQQQQYSTGQQQQQYYQPPLSATTNRQGGGSTGAHDKAVFGLSARVAALLSYLFTWVGGLFFLLFERRNRYVRYAAAQSVATFGPLFIVYLVLKLIALIPFLGTILLAPIVGLLVNIIVLIGGILWIFLMIQSYRGVEVRLPIVSTYADALLARFSGSRRKASI